MKVREGWRVDDFKGLSVLCRVCWGCKAMCVNTLFYLVILGERWRVVVRGGGERWRVICGRYVCFILQG